MYLYLYSFSTSKPNYQNARGRQIFLRPNTTCSNLCSVRALCCIGSRFSTRRDWRVDYHWNHLLLYNVRQTSFERNLIWSKLRPFVPFYIYPPSYSGLVLDLKQSEALETLGVVPLTSKIFSSSPLCTSIALSIALSFARVLHWALHWALH